MPKIRNVSPYGSLDVPLLGQVVEGGALVEVTNEQARVLLKQADNWQAHKPATRDDKPAAKASEQ